MVVTMSLKTWKLLWKVCTSDGRVVAHYFYFFLLTVILENLFGKVAFKQCLLNQTFELLKKHGNFRELKLNETQNVYFFCCAAVRPAS